jgi:hypothetical protein
MIGTVISHYMILEKPGDFAWELWRRSLELNPNVASTQGGYGQFLLMMGHGEEALVARLPETYYLPSDIAMFYIIAGEKDKALDWLKRGLEIHDRVLTYLELPFFDSIRSDPRFRELLHKVNLPLRDIK